MNKQPQTCYVVSDKHSTGVYHSTQESTPCRKLKNVYIFTKEELEAMKAEWQREQWISVKDKKPTRQDADENGYIDCAFWNNSKMEYYRGSAIWFTIANVESDLTMWKRQISLPQPPKK